MNLVLGHPRTWPLWDVFFPPFCAVCEQPLERTELLFCARCWAEAPVADPLDMHKLNHVQMARAGFRYSGADVVRESVHALKYEGLKKLAAIMARRLVSRLPTRFVEADVVWVPVPLHWRRQLARGFNQSQLLTRELAAVTGHAGPVPLLKRVRYTPTQTARTYRQRSANIRDAFAVRRTLPVPQKVLLIDDVITTGATVDECARTLQNAGVEWVDALSFALAHHA